MKVIVIKENESVIYNGIIYKNGEAFEANDLIAKSLIERGYVKEENSEEEAKMQTGYLDKEQLEAMSYPDLKSLASQMGLDAKGKKEELIARICEAEVNVEEETTEGITEDENTEGANSEEETTEGGDLPNTSMPE